MDRISRIPADDPLTGRTLLWLELLGIALGAATFAIDPLSFIHPLLAVAGLAWMVIAAVGARTIPALSGRTRVRFRFEIAAMFAYALLMTASTGATSSPFISLYVLPVIASALLFRPWQVLALACACAGLALLQSGFLDAMNDMFLLTSAAVLLNVLAPPAAGAMILARVRGRAGIAEVRAKQTAERDALTGLLNLQAFEALLDARHREAERTGHSYSVVVADVDNIRQINETLGHDAGSQLIATVAKALTRSIRTGDHAARMGGDVFVILLSDADQAVTGAIVQRIRNNVYNGTLLVENKMIRGTVSTGAATFPRDAQTPKAMMIVADQRKEQDKLLRRAPANPLSS